MSVVLFITITPAVPRPVPAFFSESNFDGKIQRGFDNMRTEYAWYVALDATHHYVGHLPSMEEKMYDLGISHIKIGRELYRTPLGGFINHSDKPNCQKIEVDNKWYLQTLRDIKKGEELTLKYTFYKV